MSVPYYRAAYNLRSALESSGIHHSWLVTEGESHVTRARNNLAATFLTQTDYQTLAFIDSDIEMDPDDFMLLLDQPGVRGAAVATKTPDFSECLSVFVSGIRPKRSEMPVQSFQVDYLGSAVLFIDRDVFERLKASELVSEYTDPIIGQAWDFFRDGVSGDNWLSEDYGFCDLCNEAGIPVLCDPSVIVKHYGVACWSF